MKIRDGIFGLVIGDALGVPVEFRPKEYLDEHPVTEMLGHGTYNKPKGTWSDDSSMALATMGGIIKNDGAVDYDIIMKEFVKWFTNGEYSQEVGRSPFDYGNTTGNAIYNYMDGVPVSECGGRGERDNGNGSLMRILPLAYVPGITYEEIEGVSALTHAHPKSKISCVLYVEIARSMLEEDLEISEHIAKSCEKIKDYYGDCDELVHFKNIFDTDYDVYDGRAFVIKTLEAALYCLLETESFRDVVLMAVNLGRDTDTVAAVTGGLAGIYYGYDNIPSEWIDDIYQNDFVFGLCDDFENLYGDAD